MEKRILFFLDELYFRDQEGYGSAYAAGSFLKDLELPLVKSYMFPVAEPNSQSSRSFSTILCKNDYGSVYCLPSWTSLVGFVKSLLTLENLKFFSDSIGKAIEENDLFWVRSPSLPGLFLAKKALEKNKRVILHIAGDIRSAWLGKKYGFLGGLIGALVARLLHKSLLKCSESSNVTVLCTGHEILNAFLPCAPNCHFFVDSLIKSDDFSEHEPAENMLRFLYLGRIQEEKGVFVLLKALVRLKKAQISFQLNCYGFGPDEEKFKNAIIEMGLSQNVCFEGYVDNQKIKEVIAQNDILVCPSCTSEGFPRVIIEAWSGGLAVISSRVGGIEGLGKNRQNIVFVDPNSVDSLYEGIVELASNPILLKNLMSAAKVVRHEMSKDSQARLVGKIISKILVT